MDSMMVKALESITGLGLGVIALWMMWKILLKQIASSAEEQRLEREQHKKNIERIADTLGASISKVCDVSADVSSKSCAAITHLMETNHQELMRVIDVHDERAEKILNVVVDIKKDRT